MQRMTPFALMLGLALATTAHAKPEKGQVKFDANAPVAEQIRNVETAINSEDYSEIGLEDKSRVQQALGRIKIKMGDHERVEQVSPQDRTEIFNDQEVINTIMTRAHADSRAGRPAAPAHRRHALGRQRPSLAGPCRRPDRHHLRRAGPRLQDTAHALRYTLR